MPFAGTKTHEAPTENLPQDFTAMEDWLDMAEPTGPSGRAALIEWCEAHPVAVITAATFAFWTPVIIALCFG